MLDCACACASERVRVRARARACSCAFACVRVCLCACHSIYVQTRNTSSTTSSTHGIPTQRVYEYMRVKIHVYVRVWTLCVFVYMRGYICKCVYIGMHANIY